jgi:hypothetical protein
VWTQGSVIHCIAFDPLNKLVRGWDKARQND